MSQFQNFSRFTESYKRKRRISKIPRLRLRSTLLKRVLQKWRRRGGIPGLDISHVCTTKGLSHLPPARTSVVSGVSSSSPRREPEGDWEQFPDGAVEKEIRRLAGNPNTSKAEKAFEESSKFLETKRDDILSILRTSAGSGKADPFIERLIEEVEGIKAYTAGRGFARERVAGKRPSHHGLGGES